MSSAAQVAANRENGKKSHGPVTEAGKQASSMNNFRHGLAGGGFYFLEHENPEVYDVVLNTLIEEHHPKTPTEKLLVQKMAQAQWLAQRAIELQTGAMSAVASPFDSVDVVNKWARYQMQHERVFQQSLNQLLKLRAETRTEQIAFESNKRAQAAEPAREQQRQTRVEHDNIKTEILHQKLEREKANAMTASMKAGGAMERHLGTEGMKMIGQMMEQQAA
jgi:hypothetical protein